MRPRAPAESNLPRYFFNTEDGQSFTEEEGVELPDHDQARYEALISLAELLKSKNRRFWDRGKVRLTVTDASGRMLFVLDVSATEAPAVTRDESGEG